MFDGTWVYEGYHGQNHGEGYHDYKKAWFNRQFFTTPAPEPAQWYAVRLFSLCARYFDEVAQDHEMAEQCLNAAQKVYSFMRTADLPLYEVPVYPPLGHDGLNRYYAGYYKDSALRFGSQACAAMELYKAAPTEELRSDAVHALTELSKFQIKGEQLSCACFWEVENSKRLANNYYYFFCTNIPMAFTQAVELWPNDANAAEWKRTIIDIGDMIQQVCGKNPYGRVPGTWSTRGYDAFEQPGSWSFSSAVEPVKNSGAAGEVDFDGELLAVEYEYENFCYNLDVAARGVFLMRAAALLNNDNYAALAQRQLDWLLGANRFDASNIEGVGYNQPHRGIFGEFFPPVPQIPGGVFVGLNDLSFDERAYGYDNEYDMPMVGWTLRLLTLTESRRNSNRPLNYKSYRGTSNLSRRLSYKSHFPIHN